MTSRTMMSATGVASGDFSRQHQSPHTIAFGKNADNCSVLYDDDKSDVLFSHEADCREHLIPGTDCPQSL